MNMLADGIERMTWECYALTNEFHRLHLAIGLVSLSFLVTHWPSEVRLPKECWSYLEVNGLEVVGSRMGRRGRDDWQCTYEGRSWDSCSFLPNPTRWPDNLLLSLRLTGLNLSSHCPRLKIISQAIGHWLLIMVLSCPMEVCKTAWTLKLVT